MPDPDGPSAEDEAWASIVANFGDRAELAPEEVEAPAPAPEPTTSFTPFESDEHYQPPVAPRVGLAAGARGAAWLGVFGVPAIFLVAVLFSIELPTLIAGLLVLTFLGGLGYLFITMSHGHDDDPWDDGARV